MAEHNYTKEHLEKRRDEILAQLNRTEDHMREEFNLDRDPEEQAIQIEQDEVWIGMEENLRKELTMIEDALLDFE